MATKESRTDDLSTNQEYFIAFVVFALFGLMYWFFMHDNDVNIANLEGSVPEKVVTVSANAYSKPSVASTETSEKDAEVEARRQEKLALDQREAEVAQQQSEIESLKAVHTEKLSALQLSLEQEQKLNKDKTKRIQFLNNLKQKEVSEATAKVAETAQKLQQVETQKETLKSQALMAADLSKNIQAERAKAESMAKQLAEANQLLETERLKVAEATQKLADVQKLVEAERNKTAEVTEKLTQAQQLAALESDKTADVAQQLTQVQQLAEAERNKAEEVTQQLAQMQQLAESERNKATNVTQQLAQLQQLAESEQSKVATVTQQLAELEQLAETERNKANEATIKLEEAKRLAELEANKSTESAQKLAEIKRLADAEAAKLAETQKAMEVQRMKALSTAEQLAEVEQLKAEEQARRIAEEKQRKLLEAEYQKAEQELEEVKRMRDAEAAKLKSELEKRITIAQDTLFQQELSRLNFTLGNGRTVTISKDSFADKVKRLLISNKTNQSLVIDNVNFASGSATLNAQAEAQVENLAGVLLAYQTHRVLIKGHTDNTGDERKNMVLSLNRSMQIKKRLVELGVESGMIGVEGMGSQNPIADNSTAEGRKENRRIELLLLDK